MTEDSGQLFLLSDLTGHEGPRLELEQALSGNKLHHGWLFTGPRGIGKALTALLFASALLENAEKLTFCPDSKTAHLIETGAHPDFLYVSRPKGDKGKLKSDIPVDSIRKLSRFFSLRPAMGGWRVAVIDSIDELNASSANALLKTLEEPPSKSLLILISHGESPTLPTLKSRCRKLRFVPLEEPDALKILSKAGIHSDEAASVLSFTPGRPGIAMSMLEKDTRTAIDAARRAVQPQANAKTVKDAMQAAARSEEAFKAAYTVIRRQALSAARSGENSLVSGEWAKLYSTLQQIESETLGLNMDKSQAISSALLKFQRQLRASSV